MTTSIRSRDVVRKRHRYDPNYYRLLYQLAAQLINAATREIGKASNSRERSDALSESTQGWLSDARAMAERLQHEATATLQDLRATKFRRRLMPRKSRKSPRKSRKSPRKSQKSPRKSQKSPRKSQKSMVRLGKFLQETVEPSAGIIVSSAMHMQGETRKH